MKKQFVIAIDVTHSITGRLDGIANVARRVTSAFHNDKRFTVHNIYFHSKSMQYYIMPENISSKFFYTPNSLSLNFFFFIRILDYMRCIFFSKKRTIKLTKCYIHSRNKRLFKLLLKLFYFVARHGKSTTTINADKTSCFSEKLLGKINIKKLPKLDFSKIDIYFHPSIADCAEFADIIVKKSKYEFKLGVLIYDLISIRVPEVFPNKQSMLFANYINSVMQNTDFIITDSQYVRQDFLNFVKESNKSYDPQNVVAVQLATDGRPDVEIKNANEVLKKYNLISGKYAIILCTIEPRKNHRLLINIWKQLIKNNKNSIIPLVIAGGYGWMADDIIADVQHNPDMQNNVIMTGKVSNEEKDILLKNARFSLFPSISEGWGMPITESLQVGVPVISSNNSSMPEAGHGITKMIDVLDFDAWYKTVLDYITDDSIISENRKLIANTTLRKWSDFDKEITNSIHSFISSPSQD